jgi:hypothetical protein
MVESEIFEQHNKQLRNKKQANYRKRQKTRYYGTNKNSINKQNNNNTKRHKLGRMDQICIHCGAKFWIEEKDCNSSQTSPSAVLVVKLIYHLCLNHHHIY